MHTNLTRLLLALILTCSGHKAIAGEIDPKIQAISRSEASGEFTQKRFFKGMSKPLLSKGDFAYRQNKGLLWRTLKPIENELFADRHGVQTTALGNTQTLTGKVDEKVSQLIFSLLAMDIEQLQTDFTLASRWQAQRWQLELAPKSALMAAAIKSITIWGSERIELLTLTTAQGDITEITFESDSAPNAVSKLSQRLNK
jgi:outer membrane lipoprotein-sorting protein